MHLQKRVGGIEGVFVSLFFSFSQYPRPSSSTPLYTASRLRAAVIKNVDFKIFPEKKKCIPANGVFLLHS